MNINNDKNKQFLDVNKQIELLKERNLNFITVDKKKYRIKI